MTSAPANETVVADARTRPKQATHRWRFRYPNETVRDRRLDMLRGYALAAMSINHLGLHHSYLHLVSGRSNFLVSAAEAFLLISGFTLGFISRGRTHEEVTKRVSARSWTVYLATIGISLALGLLSVSTDLELWGAFGIEGFDGPMGWIGQVVTLQTAMNGADILVAYVLFLGAAVGALRLMAGGRSRVVLGAIVASYSLSQIAGPENMQLGFASFRAIVPNAPLFFGGLLIGFHRDELNAAWHRIHAHQLIDAAMVACAVLLGWLHVTGWHSLTWLGYRLDGPDLSGGMFLREFQMSLLPLLTVFLFLRVAWIVVDLFWVPINRAVGWIFLPLGEASLFTFVAHIAAIPLMTNNPWWQGQDVGSLAATVWVSAYLAVIYGAVYVRRHVLQRLRAPGHFRETIRSRGPEMATALLAVVFVIASLSAGVTSAAAEIDEQESASADMSDWVGENVDAFMEGRIDINGLFESLEVELGANERAHIVRLFEEDWIAAESELLEHVRAR